MHNKAISKALIIVLIIVITLAGHIIPVLAQ